VRELTDHRGAGHCKLAATQDGREGLRRLPVSSMSKAPLLLATGLKMVTIS
jgi:hypothetical protein